MALCPRSSGCRVGFRRHSLRAHGGPWAGGRSSEPPAPCRWLTATGLAAPVNRGREHDRFEVLTQVSSGACLNREPLTKAQVTSWPSGQASPLAAWAPQAFAGLWPQQTRPQISCSYYTWLSSLRQFPGIAGCQEEGTLRWHLHSSPQTQLRCSVTCALVGTNIPAPYGRAASGRSRSRGDGEH